VRNLPKREFYEGELKELMMVVIDEWLKANNKEAANSKSQKKKYLK
jgi:hypothetical protein